MPSPRITSIQLEALRARITRALDVPPAPYTPGPDDRPIPCPRAFYICAENGGYSLRQMAASGTGESDALGTGNIPARELLRAMQAFLAGIEARDTQLLTQLRAERE